MNCSRNDVVLLPIPFSDLSSTKVRPAIVIGHDSTGCDLYLVPITSRLSYGDFLLSGWQSCGLNVPSAVKGQLATLESKLVLKIVGRLSEEDVSILDGKLREWLIM
ncbi:MAG: type II toxin-antitoxin system PemK/MazF family toxin [Verrucomicrobia bacterium]|jgi:mRNA interferase MazF|nr:MAG: type II toxin-antitoxin system PemK/MazF family toxin [Verrucomicrobiota bacterium]